MGRKGGLSSSMGSYPPSEVAVSVVPVPRVLVTGQDPSGTGGCPRGQGKVHGDARPLRSLESAASGFGTTCCRGMGDAPDLRAPEPPTPEPPPDPRVLWQNKNPFICAGALGCGPEVASCQGGMGSAGAESSRVVTVAP